MSIGTDLTQLIDPQLIIDNIEIDFMPSTVKYTKALGEKTVKAVARGNNRTVPLYCNMADTKISTFEVEIPNTKQAQAAVATFNQTNEVNSTSFAIKIISEPDNFTLIFPNMFLVNDPQFSQGADSSVALEFKGGASI